MRNLNLSQQYLLYILKDKPKIIYRKKCKLGLLAIGIWELFQYGAIDLKKNCLISISGYDNNKLQDDFLKELLLILTKSKKQSLTAIVEKHIIYSSRQYKRYMEAISNSLVEQGYIIELKKCKMCRKKYKISNDFKIEFNFESNNIIKYVMSKIENTDNKDTSITDYFMKKYVDKLFDEFKFHKLETLIIIILSFFTDD